MNSGKSLKRHTIRATAELFARSTIMKTATFAIGGMHCAACAVRNERTLIKIPGVIKANVNLGTRRARIEFDEGAVTETAPRGAVTDNGDDILSDEAAGDPRRSARQEDKNARER